VPRMREEAFVLVELRQAHVSSPPHVRQLPGVLLRQLRLHQPHVAHELPRRRGLLVRTLRPRQAATASAAELLVASPVETEDTVFL